MEAPLWSEAEELRVATSNPLGRGGCHFISSSIGSDSYTAAQAHNSSTPWKTLSKVNSQSFSPGDKILFKRGDTFYGILNITTSGNVTAPITYGSYDVGNKPVITGFTTLTTWTPLGNGVWQSSCPSCSNNLNMVTVNNINTAMGRWPNEDTVNSGWLSYESSNLYYIIDNQLSSTPDWDGAEVVVRKHHWIIQRYKITSHTGNTINFTGTMVVYQGIAGYGYFIQNDPKTLDKVGEWYFNNSNKNLLMYFGTNNPNSYVVKASTTNNLVDVQFKNYVAFSNISFEGSNDRTFNIRSSRNVYIRDNYIDFSGNAAVYGNTNGGQSATNFLLANNIINNTNDMGVELASEFTNAIIRNNTIENVALLRGMGVGHEQEGHGRAISVATDGTLFELNKILNTGYIGILFYGNNMLIKNNIVDGFCLNRDDGSGIYTYTHTAGLLAKVNQSVVGNIVFNGRGDGNGTTHSIGYANGIYMDGFTSNVNIYNNTVFDNSAAGIFINSNRGGSVHDNIAYNNDAEQFLVNMHSENSSGDVNLTTYNNIFFSKKALQNTFEYGNAFSLTMHPTSKLDNNYFISLKDNPYNIYTNKLGGIYTYYNLLRFQNEYNRELNSHEYTIPVTSYKIDNLIGINKFGNGNFITNINNVTISNGINNFKASWNNTKLDGGALEINFNSSIPTAVTAISMAVGTVSSDKDYILKYSFLGKANKGHSIRVYMLQTGSPWTRLTPFVYREITSYRTENEILFSSPISDINARLYFVLQPEDSINTTLWFDNIQFYEANISSTDLDNYYLFEYNPTTTNKIINLNGTYIDVKNQKYFGNVTIEPYTSRVLMKINNTGQLLFHSGFETNTTLTNSSRGPNYFEFAGRDLSVPSPNSWTTDLEKGPQITVSYILTGPEYINANNFPTIVSDPKNSSNKVLRYQGVYPNCYLSSGYWDGYRSQADMWSDKGGFNTLYYKVKMLLPKDFEVMQNRNESITWFTIAEFWNDDHNNIFRITLTVAKLNNTGNDTLKFRVTTETSPDGKAYYPVFTKNNLNFTIPLEKWMELEVNIVEGDNTTGKIYLAVTPQGESKKIIFNETTYTRHPNMTSPDGIAYFSPMKMYTYGYLVDAFRNSGKVMQIYWDDFEIWTDKIVI